MNTIQLSDEIAVEAEQVESVRLDEKGAAIKSKVISVGSGAPDDLLVPDDSLIVKLNDGTEFAIRGQQNAKRAWDLLEKAKQEQKLPFVMDKNAKK